MWPCVIEKADFDEDIVTLKMQSSDYTVGVGLHWLSTAHPQPKREWVGLTDEERNQLWRDVIKWGDPSHDDVDLMKALEAKLKEKNT